jgi:hypothetical protein
LLSSDYVGRIRVDIRAVSAATSYRNIPLSAALMAKQKGV